MSQTYEIRLREEFLNLRALQQSTEMRNILEIEFKERVYPEFRSIYNDPTTKVYPCRYKITYKMPVYVGEGQLNTNWKGIFEFEVPEDILMNSKSKNPAYDFHPIGGNPFNNHISPGFFCLGNAWEVSQQGFGLWYFVIAVGCIINQDEGWTDDSDKHLDSDAYKFWKYTRKMQPINDIKWPLNLRDKKVVIGPKKEIIEPKKGKFVIGPLVAKVDIKSQKPFKIGKSLSDEKQISKPKSTFKIIKNK